MLKLKIFIFSVLFFCFAAVPGIYAQSDDTYDTLRMMIDVMEIINTNYVSETKPKDLVIGAINGIVRTLDPYSQFMDEKAYKEMKTETSGSYSGVGLRIMMQNGNLTVITPMPDTPAYFLGILPEDKIIKIDDKSTEGMSSDEAVNLMRGNAGTKVKLTILRSNTKEELVFILTRKKIKIETVKKKLLDNNIGYIRLLEFNAQSAADISKMLAELSKDKIKALILDLRNNPGGLLDSAVDICGLFIKEESLVVSTKGRDKTIEQNYYTKKKPPYHDLPLIILTNRGSASASEIVAGTMQDYKRALVIGGNSFGKGSVQTVIPLSDGNALRMTVAKYYLPSGRTIVKDDKQGGKSGVTPDILIEVTPEMEGKLYMQSESVKIPKSKDKDSDKPEEKIEDEVLNKAIAVINDNKVAEYIQNPPVPVKNEIKTDGDDENNTEEKQKENDNDADNKNKKEIKDGKTRTKNKK